jgi:SAM-dependent MidA family methyltransferase
MTRSGWRERGVALDAEGGLIFCSLDESAPARGTEIAAAPGAIFELQLMGPLLEALHRLASRAAVATLFIDYGHVQTSLGDTLQAVHAHRMQHPLSRPGEADLTVQVDFEALAAAATGASFAVDGPVTQSEFLGSLGIMQRASRLMAANPAKAPAIESAVARLMSPTGMGSRFKAIGIRSPSLPPLPGFATLPKIG